MKDVKKLLNFSSSSTGELQVCQPSIHLPKPGMFSWNPSSYVQKNNRWQKSSAIELNKVSNRSSYGPGSVPRFSRYINETQTNSKTKSSSENCHEANVSCSPVLDKSRVFPDQEASAGVHTYGRKSLVSFVENKILPAKDQQLCSDTTLYSDKKSSNSRLIYVKSTSHESFTEVINVLPGTSLLTACRSGAREIESESLPHVASDREIDSKIPAPQLKDLTNIIKVPVASSAMVLQKVEMVNGRLDGGKEVPDVPKDNVLINMQHRGQDSNSSQTAVSSQN